jgi:crotonobetainyl-CoA:carnitine CoA-transferase CaiB-like acyl-CoA transferase
VLRDTDWPRFCAALDLPDLAADDRLATNAGRVAARARIVPRLAAAFAGAPAAWWLLHLHRAGLPAGPFLDFEALRHHPQVLANGYIREIDTPWGPTLVPGPPWRFGEESLPVSTCPIPGADTDSVARAAGWEGGALAGPDTRKFDHRRVRV